MKKCYKVFGNYSHLFSFIQCSKNTEKDEYEIVNLILQKM